MESVWTTKDIKVHKGKHPIGFNSARSVIYLTKVAGKPTAIFLLPAPLPRGADFH